MMTAKQPTLTVKAAEVSQSQMQEADATAHAEDPGGHGRAAPRRITVRTPALIAGHGSRVRPTSSTGRPLPRERRTVP
jgi:hypothetical protein